MGGIGSGPAKNPDALRRQRDGVAYRLLDRDGFKGEAPGFPLPRYDADTTKREDELWAWAWRTPQACAWIDDDWRWYSVAMWVRTAVVCERPNPAAATLTALTKLANEIGLTTSGLRHLLWKIGDKPAEDAPASTERSSSRGRLRAV